MRTEERVRAPRRGQRLNPVDAAILSIVARRIRAGRLEVDLPDGSSRGFAARADGPHAHVDLHDGRLLRRLATTGAIGLADGYIEGDYDAEDLASFIELMAMHVEPSHKTPVPGALDRVGRAIWRTLGRGARPRGPLQDIVQHYDLGNAFYGLWLDPSMTYSSAYFARDEMSLQEAQLEKYRRLADAADIRAGHRVIEIGSGWGAFAAYLAGEREAYVTTLTVSKEQANYVRDLAAERGLSERIDVRLEDFAAHRGTYARAVSVEMIESIPGARWSEYFRALHDLVEPGGVIGLQAITVADHHWEASRRNPDFIRRYVFPGGQVPAPMVLRGLTARAGLRWHAEESFGHSYARTLRYWREAFDARWPQIEQLGFDERFRRMWRYYLAYCEGGFRAGRADVRQIVLARD